MPDEETEALGSKEIFPKGTWWSSGSEHSLVKVGNGLYPVSSLSGINC